MKARSGSRATRVALAGVAFVGITGVSFAVFSSTALWTDSKTTTAAPVTAGTISLALGQSASSGGLAVTGLMPGDTTYTKLSVQNSGTASARVSSTATWAAANALTGDIQLSLVTVATSSATCDSTVDFTTPLNSATTSATVSNVALTSNVATITTAAAHGLKVGQPVTVSGLSAGSAINGSYLVASVPTTTTFTVAKTNSNITSTADTGTVTIPTVSTSGTSMTVYGDSTQGSQTGDRTFTANLTEYYCVKLNVPLASTAGGLSGTVQLNFASEQTANNP